MTSEKIINKEFESIKKDLITRYQELGMKASGKWENSEINIDASSTNINASIIGESYTEQLIFGRKPGGFPPTKAIEQWLIDKGIQPIEKSLKISSLAFLIARKIAKEGSKYYRQGGTDLIESVITPERLDKIINQVGVINVNKTVTTLTTYLKSIAI
jgi:hypothetical protein